MRAALFLLALVSPALAQVPEAERAWSEAQSAAAEVASASDCVIACKALGSLERATDRLCALGSEHCEEARSKLREATERVRASCPSCARAEPTPPTEPGTSTLAQPEAAPRRGGCASCSATESAPNNILALTVLTLGLALRRKRASS